MKKSTIGLAPGTLVYDGVGKKTKIKLISYQEKTVKEKEIVRVAEITAQVKKTDVLWVQVNGLRDVEKIAELGESFKIEILILEDILTQNQRPKFQSFETGDFITLRKYHLKDTGKIISEQISIIVGKDYVITFCDDNGNIFGDIEKRFEKSRKRLMKHGSSYLMYALLDFIIDEYFLIQEHFENTIEDLAKAVSKSSSSKTREKLYEVRTQLLLFRKSILPLLEVIDRLKKAENHSIGQKSIKMYLDDLNDHLVHIQDLSRTYTEMLEGLSSLYFSTTSDKTNEVMRALTAITIIFLPLTLIAGIYGMNFQYIPETKAVWGYPVAIIFMLLVATSITLVLKKKKWL